MQVWIVGVSDCEANSIKVICSTKKIAERELFKIRDNLIAEWVESDKQLNESNLAFCKERKIDFVQDDMYKKMIVALSSDDYENWNNYPHDLPYLYVEEVLEK